MYSKGLWTFFICHDTSIFCTFFIKYDCILICSTDAIGDKQMSKNASKKSSLFLARPLLNSLLATTIILVTFALASAQSGGTQVFIPMVSNSNNDANIETNQDAADPDLSTLIDVDTLMQEMGVVAEETEILDEEPSAETADELVALGSCWRSTLRLGNSGSSVQHAQNQLLKVGGTPAWYIRNSGGADGYFGNGTWSAVYSYQKMVFPGQSWEWDGVIGSKTWEKLGCNSWNTPVGGASTPSPTATPYRWPTATPTRQPIATATPRPVQHNIIGSFERAGSPGPNQLSVRGWAFLNTNQSQNLSIEVHIWKPKWRKFHTLANKVRYDVNRNYGVRGNHGFDTVISDMPSGNMTVCVKAIAGNQGGVLVSKWLGCKYSIKIQSPPPPTTEQEYNISGLTEAQSFRDGLETYFKCMTLSPGNLLKVKKAVSEGLKKVLLSPGLPFKHATCLAQTHQWDTIPPYSPNARLCIPEMGSYHSCQELKPFYQSDAGTRVLEQMRPLPACDQECKFACYHIGAKYGMDSELAKTALCRP